jgi:PIN domain nuclease of toxin-antitoxin system
VRLLLDTHSFLWFVGGDPQLSALAQRAIADVNNERYLSIASAWEIAIKTNLQKLQLSAPFPIFMNQVEQNAIDLLPVTLEHLNIVANLPLHHRDPFDRLLIAQALTEGLPIISADSMFDAYPITRLW